MIWRIPLSSCTYGEEEIQAVDKVLRSTQVTMGEECLRFEHEFADKVGARHAVFVNSGSSANLLAWFVVTSPMLSGAYAKGSEVIVPAVSWGTTYWPIFQAGLRPVIIDSKSDTLQMDVSMLEQAITKDTVAINPVHILGNAVDMLAVEKAAETYGLGIIEDACEALGVEQIRRTVGTFGVCGTYSFYFSHHITTIEGGMLVTDDDGFADVARMMRSHGWSRASNRREEYEAKVPSLDPNFFFVTQGFNLRPTEINAAIGRIQLRKLDSFNDRRREISRYWAGGIASGLFNPMQITARTKSAYAGFPVVCASEIVRDDLKRWLNERGIETRHIVSGDITRHPAMKGLEYTVIGRLTGADKITDCGLLWGLHPGLSDSNVEYVAESLKEFSKCQK